MSAGSVWQDLAAPAALAASSLRGLALWAAAAGTRPVPASAGGGPALHRAGGIGVLVALQIASAWACLGVAGGLFSVACAWMGVGWCFVLALNAVPQRTLAVARWLGAAGVLACIGLLAGAALARA